MFIFIRRILRKLLPTSLKYSLIRGLPKIEIFLAGIFRGIDKLWIYDSCFLNCYYKYRKRSLLDIRKAYILYLCAKNAKHLNGVYAEFGVYKGAGSKIMLEGCNYEKKILLFDTFIVFPEI